MSGPYCELHDMDRAFCEHGLAERRQTAATAVAAVPTTLLISPTGLAHFPGCMHKGDDDDFTEWGELDTLGRGHAWATASRCRPPAGSAPTEWPPDDAGPASTAAGPGPDGVVAARRYRRRGEESALGPLVRRFRHPHRPLAPASRV